MTTLEERLVKAIDNSGLSLKEIGAKIGKDERTIRNYKKDGKKIPSGTLSDLADICNVSLFWFLSGNGNMTKEDDKEDDNSALATINVYEDVSASARYCNMKNGTTSKTMYLDKIFLKQFFNITKYDALDIIRIIGDSMLPEFKDGEYILVEREIAPRNGDTVIAKLEDELYIKNYRKTPFDNRITLISNNNYDSIKLDTEEKLNALSIIGIVRSKIKLY